MKSESLHDLHYHQENSVGVSRHDYALYRSSKAPLESLPVVLEMWHHATSNDIDLPGKLAVLEM